MKANNFSLDLYFERINFQRKARVDLETLSGIISNQLQSIPFENTEVQRGKIPSLIPEDIVSKILINKRGGYCYEINGLLTMALDEIGFDYYITAARPMFYPERRPKTHMVVIVSLDKKLYLCDTGFGGYALRQPIEIIDNNLVMQDGDEFKMELVDGEYILSALVANEWVKQYGFSCVPQEWIEFSLANYFNATSKDAIFTQKKLAIIQTKKGRKVLVDNELKLIENGVVTKLYVEYEDAITKHFGLSVF